MVSPSARTAAAAVCIAGTAVAGKGPPRRTRAGEEGGMTPTGLRTMRGDRWIGVEPAWLPEIMLIVMGPPWLYTPR